MATTASTSWGRGRGRKANSIATVIVAEKQAKQQQETEGKTTHETEEGRGERGDRLLGQPT